MINSFVPEVTADGSRIVYAFHYDEARHDAVFTLGSRLCRNNESLAMGLSARLIKHWSYLKDKCDKIDIGDIKDYKQYAIILPEACEPIFRDPKQRWEPCDLGVRGVGNLCSDAQSLFYMVFLFTKKPKNATPARASTRCKMLIDESEDVNPFKINRSTKKESDNKGQRQGHQHKKTQRRKEQ